MNTYCAPIEDMLFAMRELAGLEEIAAHDLYADASVEVAQSVLQNASRFSAEVLVPINRSGDIEGARKNGSTVCMPDGWCDAYAAFVKGGWPALSVAREQGGQQLPLLVAAGVEEIWNSGSLAFGLLSLLSRGAVNVLQHVGSPELKEKYLSRLVSGEWTGTMVLTEPQAGSDLSAVRTKAVKQADGSYRLSGTKIFITYGDHDLAPNIVHMVLARVEGAPDGAKGISLFLVPKRLVQDDGSLGPLNDVHCVSLERKLGLHASPTCVMAFGESQGATGYLVGELNRGLEHMFVMMNSARFAVGIEGIGIAERAYQQARDYARSRTQGVEQGAESSAKVSIIQHPDVRRMLLGMKARIEAMRALGLVIAARMDRAVLAADEQTRNRESAFVDLMMPIVKGWFAETGLEIASMGIQVHGGMGFIEETGVAQLLRDARITTIYEGTTGIQAMDLVGRKIRRERGATIRPLIEQMKLVADELVLSAHPSLQAVGRSLARGISALGEAVDFLVDCYRSNPKPALAGSVPFLELFGIVAGGWQMGRAALAAQRLLTAGGSDTDFLNAKILTCQFYADHLLPKAVGLSHSVVHGARATLALDEALF